MRTLVSVIGLALAGQPALATCPTPMAPSAVQLDADEEGYFQFGEPADISASVVLADIDRDSDLDAIVGNGRHWAQTSRVYVNHRGRFIESRALDGGDQATAYQVVAGDFDGDGDIDAVVVRDGVRSTLEFNDGRGRFTRFRPIGPVVSARGAATGDIDGDGTLDLLVSVREEGTSFVAYGARGDPLSRIVKFADEAPTVGVALGDIDGDGDLDGVFAQRGKDGGIRIARNRHGRLGGMEPLPGLVGDTRELALGDFDRDGRLDVVAARVGSPILVLYNRGSHFEPGAPIGPADEATYDIVAADLDKDGDLDLAAAHVGSENAIFLQDRDCWLEVKVPRKAQDTYSVAVGDLNGDGFADLVYANSEGRNAIHFIRPGR